jgi:putative oxidoreductase
LLLRLMAGASLIVNYTELHKSASVEAITCSVIAALGGLLLLAGLWTPAAGAIVVITELLITFSRANDPWVGLMLAGLGVALVLLGPGVWSVDARLYGWKRIEIRRSDK